MKGITTERALQNGKNFIRENKPHTAFQFLKLARRMAQDEGREHIVSEVDAIMSAAYFKAMFRAPI